MTLWRLEWLRLRRTHRWVALAAVFALAGISGPLITRHLDRLVEGGAGGNVRVTVVSQRPLDAIASFASQVQQLGVLVVVLVAAAALAFDARPEASAFLRTRAPAARLLLPRAGVMALAAMGTYVFGAALAWYETAVLLGGLPAGDMLAGIALGALFMAFAVTVVALCAALVRSVMGVALAALVALIGMALLGVAEAVGAWLPTRLLSAVAELPGDAVVGDFARAAVVAVIGGGAALAAAARLLDRREV
jgi:ABC-2 type transport system permease protein